MRKKWNLILDTVLLIVACLCISACTVSSDDEKQNDTVNTEQDAEDDNNTTDAENTETEYTDDSDDVWEEEEETDLEEPVEEEILIEEDLTEDSEEEILIEDDSE